MTTGCVNDMDICISGGFNAFAGNLNRVIAVWIAIK